MQDTPLHQRLDISILRGDATSADVHKAAADAMQHGLRAVVAAPAWTSRLATMLRGSGVRVVSVVSYPLGFSKPTVKAIEATSTLKDGADEIEITAHLPPILSLDLDGARAELLEIVRAARATRRDAVISVAVDVDRLMRDAERAPHAIEVACRAIRESGCDGIVINGVEAMVAARPLAESLRLKAVVRDAAEARRALDAGASVIGSNDAVAMLTGASS
jgi:deoxyribose-phosphate aldolase